MTDADEHRQGKGRHGAPEGGKRTSLRSVEVPLPVVVAKRIDVADGASDRRRREIAGAMGGFERRQRSIMRW